MFGSIGSDISKGWKGITDFFTGTGSSLQTTENLTPQQKKALEGLITQLTGPTEGYLGKLTAGPNAVQGLSLSALEQQAMNQVNAGGAGGDQGIAAQAYKDILSSKPQDLTSYFQQALFDPAMKEFQQSILPAMESQFQGLAGYGSDRMLATGRATGNFMTNLSGQMSSAVQDALQKQVTNKLAAAGGLTNVSTQAIQNALALQQGGNIAQTTAQQPLTAAYNEFQRQQQAKQLNIQDLLGALNVQTTTPVVVGGKGGLLSGSGGSAIGAAISKFM